MTIETLIENLKYAKSILKDELNKPWDGYDEMDIACHYYAEGEYRAVDTILGIIKNESSDRELLAKCLVPDDPDEED